MVGGTAGTCNGIAFLWLMSFLFNWNWSWKSIHRTCQVMLHFRNSLSNFVTRYYRDKIHRTQRPRHPSLDAFINHWMPFYTFRYYNHL